MVDSEHFLFVEKYRPRTIEDCILPQQVKNTFRGYKEAGRVPSLLLFGPPGIGKTSIARALCDEVAVDHMLINGSEENGIDVLRNKIKSFASTISLTDAKKVVIIDEADYLNSNSTQPALRAFLEEFSDNCTFIFTCNYKDRIIPALHSRCSVIDFKIPAKERVELAGQFFKRIIQILKSEGIDYDQKVVAELVQKHLPDYRRVLNEIQRYSVSGKIDSGILLDLDQDSFKELFKNLKEKNFTEVRKWAARNVESNDEQIYRTLYDQSNTFVVQSSVPQLILILADYSYKSAFVADKELNMVACLVEIMAECSFK